MDDVTLGRIFERRHGKAIGDCSPAELLGIYREVRDSREERIEQLEVELERIQLALAKSLGEVGRGSDTVRMMLSAPTGHLSRPDLERIIANLKDLMAERESLIYRLELQISDQECRRAG